MDTISVLQNVSMVTAIFFGGIILLLTYEMAVTGSFEDACIQITNLIKGFMHR
jgi:hypothetical protein